MTGTKGKGKVTNLWEFDLRKGQFLSDKEEREYNFSNL
jgi:hypothetical protein